MTTPFLRCAEAFDAHPGDHELARLIDAIGERRALSGVGMSDRVARLSLSSARNGQAAIEAYRTARDAFRQQEASEAAAKCRCGETLLSDCQDERPRGGITHAPNSPIYTDRMRRFASPIEEDGE
mgnify:FL=1